MLPNPTDMNRMDALSPENINKNRVREIVPGRIWGHLTSLHQIMTREDIQAVMINPTSQMQFPTIGSVS